MFLITSKDSDFTGKQYSPSGLGRVSWDLEPGTLFSLECDLKGLKPSALANAIKKSFLTHSFITANLPKMGQTMNFGAQHFFGDTQIDFWYPTTDFSVSNN